MASAQTCVLLGTPASLATPSSPARTQGGLRHCSGSEAARVRVPALPPGAPHTVRLWVVCNGAGGGRVALAVALQCPAVVAAVREWEVQPALRMRCVPWLLGWAVGCGRSPACQRGAKGVAGMVHARSFACTQLS